MHETVSMPLNMRSPVTQNPRHHEDKLIGLMMSSSRVMVCAMAFALACLAAMPAASAASGDDGGILYIPSAASLAHHCPSSCGLWERRHHLPLRHWARLLPTRLRAYLQPHHSTSKVVSGQQHNSDYWHLWFLGIHPSYVLQQ